MATGRRLQRIGFDVSDAVVVWCCTSWYRRLTRLLRRDSAAADDWVPLAAACLDAVPVMQAVATVVIRIEIIKLMTITRIKNKNSTNSVN